MLSAVAITMAGRRLWCLPLTTSASATITYHSATISASGNNNGKKYINFPISVSGFTQRRFAQTRTAPEKLPKNLKNFSEVPGPKAWPIVGNLFNLIFNPSFKPDKIHLLWVDFFKQYGPIVKLSIPGMPTMVASLNADDLEVIMKSTLSNPIREGFVSLKMVRDSTPNNYFNKKAGLLPENGEEWWRLRSRVQGPLLQPRSVARYLPKVDAASLKFLDRVDRLRDDQGKVPDDFLQELYKWALECVGLVALDRELGCLEDNLSPDSTPLKLIHHVNEMFEALAQTEMGLQTWKLYRTDPYIRLEKAHAAFLEVADQCIQEAMESLAAAKAENNPDRTLTVMETFLNTEGLSKSDVATMVLDMLFAGVDTTSHAVGFTLYLLARNPECQAKLQTEIDSVTEGSTELLPEHIAKMHYLNFVQKESLRLYPLTVGNGRISIEDVGMSGYRIPKGTFVVGINIQMSREEKYFSRPNEFLPERWAKDRPHGPIHPFASLPFSHGTRMCIGKRVAEQEISTLLIRILQRYTVSFDSTQEMQFIVKLVLKPTTPLAYTFTPRT